MIRKNVSTRLVENTHPDDQLLDGKLLRLFDALYSSGSVTKAADMLGQTQPTVSIWLAKLRRSLNDTLFVRTAGGMVPTPRAQGLVVPVREALAALRQVTLGDRAFDPAQVTRRFRICMTDASHVMLLPSILAHVRAVAPGVTLEAAPIDANTSDALRNADADLAIGYLPSLEGGFYQQALYRQGWVCVTSARHPRIKGRMSLLQYQSEGHVSINHGTTAPLLLQALSLQAVHRNVVLTVPGFLALQKIISSTDLVATLPRDIGETLALGGAVQVHACPVQVQGFIASQYWHARFHRDDGNRWLRSVCAKLFVPQGQRHLSKETAPDPNSY